MPFLKKSFLIKKIYSKGFTLTELALLMGVLSILAVISIPTFNCARKKAISNAAQLTIRKIKEECEKNYIYGIDKFNSKNPQNYQIISKGSNNCSLGTITLMPDDSETYPTYSYEFAKSKLSYSFNGQSGTSLEECNYLICNVNKPQKEPVFVIDDGANLKQPDFFIDDGANLKQ